MALRVPVQEFLEALVEHKGYSFYPRRCALVDDATFINILWGPYSGPQLNTLNAMPKHTEVGYHISEGGVGPLGPTFPRLWVYCSGITMLLLIVALLFIGSSKWRCLGITAKGL